MTSTVYRADGRIVELTIVDTVGIHLPGDATRNMPPYRDGVRPPRRPAATGEHPTVVPRPAVVEPVDALQERFNRYYATDLPSGRHRRTGQPGLIGRLREWIGGVR